MTPLALTKTGKPLVNEIQLSEFQGGDRRGMMLQIEQMNQSGRCEKAIAMTAQQLNELMPILLKWWTRYN